MPEKNVLIVGGGIAGLSAARKLADYGIHVDLAEKTQFPGGHAIQFSCKATEQCVKCGACVAEETLENVIQNSQIKMWLNSRIQSAEKSNGRFSVTLEKKPAYIDPEKCTGCGICLEKCPEPGAVLRGYSKSHVPFYAVCEDQCLFFKDKSCSLCQEECPEHAITLDQQDVSHVCEADAVILATGFQAFDPESKPYGYKRFENVITNLDMERMLRQDSIPFRPSDRQRPRQIAFIQCVGSRDTTLGHLWCSKVCCGSALRMARLIKMRQPETEISFFYMDVQTFGKDFQKFYEAVQTDIRMIRAIPGDIFKTEDDQLRVTFLDSAAHETREELFDLVVLSVGLTPGRDNNTLAELLSLKPADSGFLDHDGDGIFTAGTARGPMSIAESVADAGRAVWNTLKYLGINHS